LKTNIRKWGNSAGTLIPAPVLVEASFALGDRVNIEAVDGKIVISQATEGMNLEALLTGSPRKCFRISNEDSEWIDARPVGKETL